MPDTVFDTIMSIVIGHEGGYVDNASDPGGRTKYGISQRSYPDVDIAQLSLEGAKAIYKRDYFDRLSLDVADPGLALVAFDAAVNNGVGQAARWLQAALGVAVDGVIGNQTKAALAACTGDKAQEALVAMHAARIYMMANLSTWQTFGRGWSRRLAHLPYQAAGMTNNNTPAATDQPPAG